MATSCGLPAVTATSSRPPSNCCARATSASTCSSSTTAPTDVARRIESHWISGPAGRLEALLEEPEEREPLAAVVVCHPHPLHGGTMHNKVVYRMARGLRRAGAIVLRF